LPTLGGGGGGTSMNRHHWPLPGIARCSTLKMLGVAIGNDFSVSQHVQQLVASSALRVLRYHGLDDAALQHVYRATVVARLTYAASAWHGFTKASERQRIDSVNDQPRSTPWILLTGYTDVQ